MWRLRRRYLAFEVYRVVFEDGDQGEDFDDAQQLAEPQVGNSQPKGEGLGASLGNFDATC